MRIYLAGPLFSEAEQKWLRSFKKELKAEGYKVIWPYELFDQEEIAAAGDEAPLKIMEGCRKALKKSALVVALLDGPQVDDGTSWEIGYAFAKNIPVLGLRTDFRAAGDTKTGLVNAMIAGSCKIIARSRSELTVYLKEQYPPVK